jgi:hypothetical protein
MTHARRAIAAALPGGKDPRRLIVIVGEKGA